MFSEVRPLWSNGPKPGHPYDFPGSSSSHGRAVQPATHTMSPMSTGSSVIAVMYDGGIVMAADKLASYGSMARFRNIERVFKANDKAVLGFGGDIADYQFIRDVIEQKVRDGAIRGSAPLDAGALHSWLTRVLYNRRSRFDPLWLSCVVAGVKQGKLFLGSVDKLGTAYEAEEVCTGYGLHFVKPMLAAAKESKPDGKLTKEEATKVIVDGMKVLYYRDGRSFNKYMLATVTLEGVEIQDDLDLKKETNWDSAPLIHGY